jgi:MFS family permease
MSAIGRHLPRTVIVLGLVSLLNDAASEMITPLLPLFLTMTLGAGPVVVGLIEGVAEATASVLKLISGRLADRGWGHKRLVLGGYATSNAARPLIGLALGWTWVLAMRFLDRVGKGLRTAPRDALIAGAVEERGRGRAFGFHRAMDHGGAIIGPLVAFVFLAFHVELRNVFLLSVIPGVVLLVLLAVRLPQAPPAAPVSNPPVRLAWRTLDVRLRGLIVSAAGLSMAAVPEAFLVLWAVAEGVEPLWVPVLWSAAHAAKALVAMPGGSLSDRRGRIPVLLMGWGIRILILILLAATAVHAATVIVLFMAYAAAVAWTEGPERALVGDFAPPHQKATAFGVYHLVTGLAALPGALLFGALWQWFGMSAAFGTAAALSTVSAAALYYVRRIQGG